MALITSLDSNDSCVSFDSWFPVFLHSITPGADMGTYKFYRAARHPKNGYKILMKHGNDVSLSAGTAEA